MATKPIALLADDSADDVALTLFVMAEVGFPFDVRVAADGEDAWGQLCALDRAPALIILDIKMPKLDGLDLLERVRSQPRWKDVPVVMLTSSDDQRDVSRAAALGANAYIRKPSDLTAFSAVIERLKDPAGLAGKEMTLW